ncbi:MAG: VacB/RNase II family 3'-5' exoribonuclease [Acidobacteriota bacterium]|nr:VacB/RNase II family 3'-5' exoribonuclease [Acidobacteriota bacterium]
MPREALSKERLLDHIVNLPHARATFKQLVRELGSRGWERTEIEDLLDDLVERGDLVEMRSGHFISTRASREYTTGKLSMHRDGYGFVIAEHPLQGIRGDLYIARESAASAMHGDRVVACVVRVAPDGRADGEILKVLRRGHPSVVGEFRLRPRGNFVIPHDERIRQWIEIPDGMEIPEPGAAQHRVGVTPVQISGPQDLEGMIVNAEILDYLDGGERVVGKVIEILGHPDDFGVDVEVMIRKHHIPHRFPADVIEQAQAISQVIPTAENVGGSDGRQDFRSLEIVTIDGETARDFDDAVWVDRLADGGYALQVHIADVSHYVRPGTPIDDEAFLRGTSVYFPDRAVPMLPLELSTEICSLKPGVDRLVLSVLLEIDHRGDIVKQEFTRGVIRSAERMTYTNVHLLLEGDAGLRDRYAPLVGRFETMRELALILNRKRVKRGSIDFDMPEPLIQFDEFGQMTGVARSDRNIAHRIIEEFMLAANEAVASHLEQAGIASLFRVHEKPEAKRVMDFEEIAASFGYSLGIGAIPVKKYQMKERGRDGRPIRKEIVIASESVVVSSRNYQKLVAKIEGTPEERILTYLMLRSLKQARYSDQNKGHFALAALSYTHFTSPIRRYPDLIVHRILSAFLDGKGDLIPQERLHAIGNECSETERRAAEAERELVEWKKAKFMEDRVGEEFSGLIISTTRFGFFVELESLFIEGLVLIDTLPGDKYGFSENTRKIIGERSRRQFSIGDHVRVRLDRVDAIERKLQFGLVEPETRRKAKRRKER